MLLRFTVLLFIAALIASACSRSVDTGVTEPTATIGSQQTTSVATSEQEPTGSALDATAERLASADFNGIIAIASDGDRDVLPFGTADPESVVPLDETTVFDIGSITKQFTGAAITALHMDGRLSVEDRVGDYLPAIGDDKAGISLHQLLTHTAGLPGGLGHDYDPITREGYVALVADTSLQTIPGEHYAYSNVGYSLLAAVIEVVSGESYETYLRQRLFEPAGLIDTGYLQPDWTDNEIAVGFVGDEVFGKPNEQIWSEEGPYWHLLGNGGLLSTADDMLRWIEALDGDVILDDEAKELMFGAHIAEGGGSSYGYGWSITDLAGHPLVTHNGGNGVFFADLLHFPDDALTIFLATNSASASQEDAAWAVASQLLGEDGDGVKPADCPLIGPDEIAVMKAIDELPSSPPGDGFARILEVVTAAPGSLDDEELTALADWLIRPAMAVGASDEAIRPEVESLQTEFDGYDVARLVAHDDGLTFAASLLGGGEPLVFSATLSATDPAHLRCLEVSA